MRQHDRLTQAAMAIIGVIAVSWLCGCEETKEAPTILGPEIPQVESLSSPAWSPSANADDPVVATVRGVPIVLSQVREALEQTTDGATPSAILDRLIELELLAQKALDAGYYRRDVVLGNLRTAMIRTLLINKFVLPPAASFFSEELLAFIYKQSRVEFDHVDKFTVIDAQFTCCSRQPDRCNQEEFRACMAEEKPHAEEVYEDLRDTHGDARLFSERVSQWTKVYPRLHLVSSFTFFYDVHKPHAEQKGYNIVNEHFARAAMGLAHLGDIAAPVASRNAWHILFLRKHLPEDHRTLDDPSVREEIISHALVKRQTAEFGEAWLPALRKRYDVEVFPDEVNTFFEGLKKDAQITIQ